MIEIKLVPPHRVEEFWPVVRPLLEKALRFQVYPVDVNDILNGLINRKAQLWLIYEGDLDIIGAFTSAIDDYHGTLIARIEHLGAERSDEWMHILVNTFESWCRDVGVKYIEVPGRRGWEKIVKPHGYSADIVIYKKEL